MADTGETRRSLIITIVSKGFADAAIAAAREAGARGATMLYARGSGIQETEKFLNISIEPEKEVVLTLVKTAAVKEIITAITEKVGPATGGRGVSFVLPVTRTAGISGDDAGKEPSDTEPPKV